MKQKKKTVRKHDLDTVRIQVVLSKRLQRRSERWRWENDMLVVLPE